jgi:septum formation protein
MKIILASDSKKDKDILDLTVMDYKLLSADKKAPRRPRPKNFVKYVKDKAETWTREVMEKYGLKDGKVVGVYTLILQQRKVVPKPRNQKELVRNLKRFSGKTHTVLTGIAVVDARTGKAQKGVSKTKVKFFKLDKTEIEVYSRQIEWVDSPGGYYIHGAGGVFIESLNGDYYNTMGLPLSKIKQMLKE